MFEQEEGHLELGYNSPEAIVEVIVDLIFYGNRDNKKIVGALAIIIKLFFCVTNTFGYVICMTLHILNGIFNHLPSLFDPLNIVGRTTSFSLTSLLNFVFLVFSYVILFHFTTILTIECFSFLSMCLKYQFLRLFVLSCYFRSAHMTTI